MDQEPNQERDQESRMPHVTDALLTFGRMVFAVRLSAP